MALTNYRRGSDKERRIVNHFRKEGCVALRSAGSHSIVDVVVIDCRRKEVRLVQSKLRGKKNLSEPEREKIIKEGKVLEGTYKVIFELWE